MNEPTSPVPWTNQYIVLYHGTVQRFAEQMVQRGVALNRGRFGTDFGQGFYTTTRKLQAQRWARRKARERADPNPQVLEVTLKLEDLAVRDSLSFVNGAPDAEQLWSFIQFCRSGAPGHGRTPSPTNPNGFYDVVFGPVAAAWQSRQSYLYYDQVSFHTPAAEDLLNKHAERRMIDL